MPAKYAVGLAKIDGIFKNMELDKVLGFIEKALPDLEPQDVSRTRITKGDWMLSSPIRIPRLSTGHSRELAQLKMGLPCCT